MREIKFRGKQVNGDQWLIGDLSHVGDENYTFIYPRIKGKEELNSPDYYQVIPETVGQFTGLLDKNGVNIFEGDIWTHNNKKFVCNWSETFGYCFVEINKNLGNFHLNGILKIGHNNRKQSDIISYLRYLEVIGNIHDNPELLA